jgi:hypothetical protein
MGLEACLWEAFLIVKIIIKFIRKKTSTTRQKWGKRRKKGETFPAFHVRNGRRNS